MESDHISVGDSDDDSTQSKKHETFLDYLMFSVSNQYFFISWEPGRMNQFYFRTTKEYGKQVEVWLEETMNYVVLKYRIATCQDRFATGVPKMLRSESKARPDTFVLKYIQTMGIEEEPIVCHGYRDRSPPSVQPEKIVH